jgi:TatD DNase family protein
MQFTGHWVLKSNFFCLFINIHTHHAPVKGERAIQNKYTHFESLTVSDFYSVGLHPWHINTDWRTQLTIVTKFCTQQNVVAIGETGLDKVCKTDWQWQEKVFVAQIQLANQLQKPLIIHCVRAWDEVFSLLKNEKVAVPVIFHGFNKNSHLAKRITDGGYYLSFGKALQQTIIQEVLKTIPLNRFFLETDDAGIEIARVYNLAAHALSIEVNALSLQLQQNAVIVFGNTFV